MLSLADARGALLDALIEANPDLAAERAEPGVLAPGDLVKVPPKAPKTVQLDSDGSHRIRLPHSANPVTIRFDQESGQVWAGEVVVLTIEGVPGEQTRTADVDGCVTFMIPARAERGEVRIGESPTVLPVTFGDLDPLSTVRGVQARLRHLGYYRRAVDGHLGPYSHEALLAFQKDNGLPVTAVLDDQTRALLGELAGI